ncbi:hypothetical protein [Scopulibacillus darangshiensis]|nr:hypothetical protein [Scopulibacillus darangshiensis]
MSNKKFDVEVSKNKQTAKSLEPLAITRADKNGMADSINYDWADQE